MGIQEILRLYTFGSTTPELAHFNTVNVLLEKVRSTHQRTETEAVETPQVHSAVIKVPSELLQAVKGNGPATR